MKNDIKSIRGQKIAVQCQTQEEAKCLYYLVQGNHAYNYASYIISKWPLYGSNTCYVLKAAGCEGVGISSIDYWTKEGFEIIQLSDILPQ